MPVESRNVHIGKKNYQKFKKLRGKRYTEGQTKKKKKPFSAALSLYFIQHVPFYPSALIMHGAQMAVMKVASCFHK
jgi:hypothetical protein